MYKTIDGTITATELKNNLGMYLDYVIDNHQVVVTKNGKPAVRLSPYITEMEQYFVLKEEAETYKFGSDTISYEEFLKLSEDTTQQLEYLNEEVIVMDSPTRFHQEISGNLHVLLRAYLNGKACKVYYAPFDVTLKKYDIKKKEWMKTPDVLQPDLVIVCDAEEKTDEKGKYMGVPSLVIEIMSPSTRSRDMVIKLNTYMISDVRELWIIDPDKRQVLQYYFEDFCTKAYNLYRGDDKLQGIFFKDLMISLMDIFEE